MIETIKNLYPLNRCLLGEGYDTALAYLKELLDWEIIEIPSGTKLQTWVVPDEWVIRDAYLKHGNKKILDYKKEPLSLMVGSCAVNKKVPSKELLEHLYILNPNMVKISDCPDCDKKDEDVRPYEFTYYEKDWGFCLSKAEWEKYQKAFKDKRKKFEVFIDAEHKPGVMKIAVHTIPGKTDREVLLFAHLDHPYQANDNLSGVACLVDLAGKIKNFDHTIKIVICPETIGSIAYAVTQDISKVDFMIALDAVGNNNTLLVQRSFDKGDKINNAAHLALTGMGISHRKGEFRFLIGSDEYVFNDPAIGIPGIMVSRYPYPEYHSCADKPEIIEKDKLEETQQFVLKTIEIMERDCVPKKKIKGPLFRSRFGVQTPSKQFNRNLDYLIYLIDGKRTLIELCCMSGVGFDYAYDLFSKMQDEDLLTNLSERRQQTIKAQKQA